MLQTLKQNCKQAMKFYKIVGMPGMPLKEHLWIPCSSAVGPVMSSLYTRLGSYPFAGVSKVDQTSIDQGSFHEGPSSKP